MSDKFKSFARTSAITRWFNSFNYLPRTPWIVLLLGLTLAVRAGAATVWLDDLDVSRTAQDWGQPHKNQSVDGHGISLGGTTFAHGFGTHAVSVLYVQLDGAAKSFSATVGLDDEVKTNPGRR